MFLVVVFAKVIKIIENQDIPLRRLTNIMKKASNVKEKASIIYLC